MIVRQREKRTLASARVLAGFLLCTALATACANYKADTDATFSIGSVRVTTSAAEVASCRLIQRVDSRDSTLGCGLTVQPTPEECLRFQVRRLGGDTLLIRGPVGDAYACAAAAPSPAAAPAPTSAPVATSPPPPQPAAVVPTPTPAPAPAPPAPAPKPAPAPASIRLTADRDVARGCVYLGELAASTACDVSGETASGDCAAQALRAGGDLIVRDAGRGLIFACKARP
ncbi:MAG TPA: hypothetical protein VMT25_02340 [Thermoanaerobaculia bacterium]|nr:hypothetical protein [Thermoanaerobaculia bacterium]